MGSQLVEQAFSCIEDLAAGGRCSHSSSVSRDRLRCHSVGSIFVSAAMRLRASSSVSLPGSRRFLQGGSPVAHGREETFRLSVPGDTLRSVGQ